MTYRHLAALVSFLGVLTERHGGMTPRRTLFNRRNVIMLIRTSGRRFEVDTDSGLYVRCPFVGDVFASRSQDAEPGSLDYWREGSTFNLRFRHLSLEWTSWRVVKALMQEERAEHLRQLDVEAAV